MSDDRFDVLERFERLVQAPEPSFEGFLRRRDRKRRNQRIVAAVVAIAVFATPVWIVATDGRSDRTSLPAEPGPTVSSDPERPGVSGLPLEGAAPSTPERGELVLRLEGSADVGDPWSMIWVYADGRLVWHRSDDPRNLDGSSIGLFEQRLTPEGIELLRSEIMSTGLFEHDLALATGFDGPFLSIQVRRGDRLVGVTWAPRINFNIPEGAPTATPEQASELERLHAFLTDPASWPASAWDDRAIEGYVPSSYSVCFRGVPEPIEPARVLNLLPEPAQDLLGAGDRTGEGCSRMTTDDARALAGIFDRAARIYRNGSWTFWLQYVLGDPGSPGNQVRISFGPVLPHGEATWLGPG